MAKQKAAPTGPEKFEVTITEFCTRLSTTDKRVELIGAFYATETNAGRIKATEEEFASRLRSFAKKPV